MKRKKDNLPSKKDISFFTKSFCQTASPTWGRAGSALTQALCFAGTGSWQGFWGSRAGSFTERQGQHSPWYLWLPFWPEISTCLGCQGSTYWDKKAPALNSPWWSLQAQVVSLGQWSVGRGGVDYLHHNEDANRKGTMLALDLAPSNLLSVPFAHSMHTWGLCLSYHKLCPFGPIRAGEVPDLVHMQSTHASLGSGQGKYWSMQISLMCLPHRQENKNVDISNSTLSLPRHSYNGKKKSSQEAVMDTEHHHPSLLSSSPSVCSLVSGLAHLDHEHPFLKESPGCCCPLRAKICLWTVSEHWWWAVHWLSPGNPPPWWWWCPLTNVWIAYSPW